MSNKKDPKIIEKDTRVAPKPDKGKPETPGKKDKN
jgi:hypothetical protein